VKSYLTSVMVVCECQQGLLFGLNSSKSVLYLLLYSCNYLSCKPQVRLIGYCVEGSLFLVYEHIDNGNLGQYLHGTGEISLG